MRFRNDRADAAAVASSRRPRSSIIAIGLSTNPAVSLGVGILLVLHAGFVYLRLMQTLFGTAALGATAWLAALAVSLVVLPVISLGKRLRRSPRRA